LCEYNNLFKLHYPVLEDTFELDRYRSMQFDSDLQSKWNIILWQNLPKPQRPRWGN